MSRTESVETAIQSLMFASGALEAPPVEDSFVGMFRPYKGLRPERYRNLMLALRDAAPALQREHIDRRAVEALFAITAYTQSWVLAREGMLQRNRLMSAEDTAIVERWLQDFNFTVLGVLAGGDLEHVFEGFEAKLPPAKP